MSGNLIGDYAASPSRGMPRLGNPIWYSMELQNQPWRTENGQTEDTGVEVFLEQLIEHGPNDIAGVFARAFDLAMRIERECQDA